MVILDLLKDHVIISQVQPYQHHTGVGLDSAATAGVNVDDEIAV